jgi:Ca2+/Na+ antiporter
MKWFEKLYVILLLVIFGGIVLHAPLTVGFGVLFPHFELLIKSWKEILMGVASVLLLVILWRRRQWKLLRDPLILLILAFAVLHLLLLPLFWQGTQATLAGILIDLRYLF